MILPENTWQRLSSLSSTELSDALDACGIEGALFGLKPLQSNTKLIGPAYIIEYAAYQKNNTGFKNAANYIDHVPPNSVLLIDNQGREDCTVWGDILTQTALYKKISGTVVNGAVRDVELIRKSTYPLYCKNHYMRSGKNRVYKISEQLPVTINQVTIHPGDIIFADDNGVLVIPIQRADEIIIKAQHIKKTEQAIINAVHSGLSLEKAREAHGYARPWLDEKDKQGDSSRNELAVSQIYSLIFSRSK